MKSLHLPLMLLLVSCVPTRPGFAQDDPEPLKELRTFARKQDWKSVIKVSSELLERDTGRADVRGLRANAYEAQRDWQRALADFDALVKQSPQDVALRQRRGSCRFRAGRVKESIVDFDRAIALDPAMERKHWQRGISYYLDGQYLPGAKQFELYQTYYGADVENVVWHMICLARNSNWKLAQSKMMKLQGVDQRVPLMKVNALFLGKATVDEVLQAAHAIPDDTNQGIMARFYAHLYLALYFDAQQQSAQRNHHLGRSLKPELNHYMWDVAHVMAQKYLEPDHTELDTTTVPKR